MDGPPPPKPPGPPPSKPPGPPPSRPPGPPPSRPESNGNPFDRNSASYGADDYSVYGNKDSDDIVYNSPPPSSSSRSNSVNTSPPPPQPPSRAPSVSAPSSPVKPSGGGGGGGNDYYDTYEDGKNGSIPMSTNPLRAMKKTPSSSSPSRESEAEMSPARKAPPALPSEAAPTNTPPPTPARGAPPPPRGPPAAAAAAEEGTEGSFVTVDTGDDKKTASPMHSSKAPSSPSAASSASVNKTAAAHPEPVEEQEDLSQPEVRVKNNMPTARGLIPVCKIHTEIPSDVLARMLLKNESVTGEFDFFYPRRGFSKRFTFLLCVCTLGLYLVVLAVQSCLHWLRNKLCVCMACADSIYYTRGKLIVTSRGRLICWFLEVDQQHNADNQTHYKISQNTKIFNADDVAQISLSYSDRLLFLNCCYGDFSTGIDISFHAFDHLALPWSRYMYTNHPSNYLLNLSSYIKNSVAYSVYNSITYGKKDPLVIRVVSNCWDKSYDGEYGLEPLEDLCKLNDALCKAMGNRAEYYPNKTASHTTDPIKRNHHTFMSARDMMDPEIQKTYGAEHVQLPGVKETYTDLTNFTMVDDDGNVTIPARWLPLSPGEEVVAAVGQYYKPTCCDKIRAVATLGLYYCRYLRNKLRERSALILTTHRVVEIMLFQSRGKIPAELGSVDVIVRSFFPKKVQSGYIRSGDGHTIESAIYCSFGQLCVSLPSTQLQFAQKMQLAASREHPLSLKEVEGLLPDNAHLQSATMTGLPVHKDANGDADASDSHKNSNGNKIKYDDSKLSPTDQILLPLMPGETLLHRFQGGSAYKPCCLINFGLFKSYLCTFATASPNVVASCGWVCLVEAFTCKKRPLLTTPACLVTTHTMYYISNTSHIDGAGDAQTIGVNYTGCCGSGYRLEPFILTWLPIRKLHDHELQITTSGSKPFGPLLCCTPPPKSHIDRYDLLVNSSEGISFPLSEDVPFKAWNKDVRVTKMQNVLSAVQTLIAKE